MEDFDTSASDSDYASSWVSWFLGCKGNEYFCEIDEEYITDRFNLTYLNSEVHHYNEALELITDGFGWQPGFGNSLLTSLRSKCRPGHPRPRREGRESSVRPSACKIYPYITWTPENGEPPPLRYRVSHS